MRWLYKIPLRFRSLFKRSRVEKELTDELRFHLEKLMEENVAKGMTPEEARYAALRELGGVDQIKEECRDMRRVNCIESFFQDARYGLRQLRRAPGFAAMVVSALALGIGANAAMFSVVNAVLLRPLPFRDPDRLVVIEGIPAVEFDGLHTQVIGWHDWVGKSRTLADVSVYERGGVNLFGGDQPVHLPAAAVSDGFFWLLGVGAIKGRTFMPEKNQPARPEAVISYDLWQGHLGADPNIVGRNLELSGKPFTVIGVMPPGFEFPGETQVWVPAALNTEESLFAEGGIMNFQIARLNPGVTLSQVRAELGVSLKQLEKENSAPFNPKLNVTPLHLQLVKDSRPALLVLMGAVALVLLIACADVTNLLLARNAARSRELAVRSAIGAGQARLIRQLLTESVLLSLTGGALGLLVGAGTVRLERGLLPLSETLLGGIRLDAGVLGFTFAVAVLTGVLAGLLPALGSSRVVLSEALKAGAGDSSAGFGFRQQHGLRVVLGIGEVGLALVLLIGATLLIRSLACLSTVNPGFRTDHLLTARLFLAGPGYAADASRGAFFERVLDRAHRLPGVRDAAWTNSLPLGEGVSVMFSVGIEGSATPKPQTSNKWALYLPISPDYFRTMGIPLVAGRVFEGRDRDGAPSVAIVSQAMARLCWPAQDPIGKRLTTIDPPKWTTVVGVVGDVRHWGLSDAPEPSMYLPLLQAPPRSAFLVIRTSGPVSATDVAGAVRAIDRGEPVASTLTGDELLARATASPRFRASVLGLFAGLALALALVGVYGIMAYSVSQRKHEIGIRMALGAKRGDVLQMVLTKGLLITGLGVAVGVGGALVLTRFLSSMLYCVKPTDPLTLVGVSLILIAVALLASYIPARRATKVDPMVALKYE
jgi:putative ABC transport system permease protein